MNKIQELERKRNAIYKKAEPINKELRALQEAEAMKERETHVGKCFVFRNGNGSEKWNLYIKNVANTEEGLITLRAEKSPNGISIETRKEWGYCGLEEKEITLEEFNTEFNKLLLEVMNAGR